MKRYDFEQEIDGSCIVEDPYGEWVKYTDIEKMVINLTQLNLSDLQLEFLPVEIDAAVRLYQKFLSLSCRS